MPEAYIPFAGGIDQAMRAELVDPNTSFLYIQNMAHTKKGALTKSLGTSALSAATTGSGTNTVGRALFSHRGELAMIDGHYAEVYTPAPALWAVKGRVPECTAKRYTVPYPGVTGYASSIPSGSEGYSYGDVCYINGYLIVATITGYGSGDTVSVSVLDATTFTPVRSEVLNATVPANAGGVRVVAVGNTAILVYGLNSGLYARTLDTTSGTSLDAGWGSATSIIGNIATLAAWQWDVDVDSTGSSFTVVWVNDSGGTAFLSIRGWSAALNAVAAEASFGSGTSAADSCVTLSASGGNYNFWVGWSSTSTLPSNFYVAQMTTQGVTTYTGAILVNVPGSLSVVISQIAIVNAGSNTGRLCVNSGTRIITRTFNVSAGAVAAVSAALSYYNLNVTARPFILGGRTYVSVQQTVDTSQAFYDKGHYVVDIGGDVGTVRPVANIAARLADVQPNNTHVAAISATKIALFNITKRSGVASGVDVAVLDFGEAAQWTTAGLGDTTYISGGMPYYLDAQRVRESGFLLRPEKPVIAPTGSGSFTITTGCRWVAIYEFVNAAGDIEWSAPSEPSDATTGSNKVSYNVTTSSLCLTSKYDSGNTVNAVRVAFYRTADNGGTPPYYRCGTIVNSLAARTAVYVDSASAATVAAHAQLYTAPGIVGTTLPRQAPPAMTHVWQHNDRIMGLADDGVSVFYSGGHIIGEALWFSDAQQFPVEGDGRNVAGWSQDGRNVIAKESALYVVDGDGPPDNGGNGTEFSAPHRIPSDVGCINPLSIVTTVGGTFFQSRRGIELLTRSFQVQWIGEPIQDTLAQVPYITGACLDVAGARVIFSSSYAVTAGVAATAGAYFIFDLTLGTWSVDSHYGASDTEAVQGACMSNVSGIPRFHWMSPGGIVYRENLSTDAAAYLDGSQWRSSVVFTAPFKLAGLAGYQQIRKIQLLCSKDSDHNLLVQYAVNDSSSFTTARTFTRAEINALDREHLEIPIGNDQKCRSIRFRFADVTPTGGTVGTGKGTTLYGLAVSYDTIPELARRQADAR